jgi:tetratricopeptide (TPR) repeat protein
MLAQAAAQETPVELFNKAMEFKKVNNCPEVLTLLNKAIDQKPDFADAWIEKGWCLNELNRSKEALPVLIKAGTLSKNDYRVYYEIAHAYNSLGSTDSAMKYFKETLKVKPGYPAANISMGDLCREKLKDNKCALSYYLKASKIDETNKKNNYWIGWCYNESEKFDSAVYYLQKVVVADAGNPLASVELGFALYSLNRFDDALSAFKPALESKPKQEMAVFYTGMCRVKTNNKSEALNKYNELVILNSSYAANLLTEIQKMK